MANGETGGAGREDIDRRVEAMFGRPLLGDARLDQMMGVILALAGEVAVLRAQVAELRAARGPEAPRALPAEAVDRDMGAFVEELFRPLLHPDFDPGAGGTAASRLGDTGGRR